ncbi:hypothetical protein [Pontibacillus sp. HMF3514]|uniref:hypothetical protein n=1 Tax=Pontibacillus sp. HMF3514 TaxID=2692425 RepID=UPI00131FF76E|nr:hypothetical protein [Pontibacillus sp. HMF3514]QHE52783.1 hypothetical protein GS400_12440 [Pontibacillus sp. HMF3514]
MNEALTEKEFQKLSLSFRRVASRFLNCNFQDYNENLKRFLLFIEESPTINDFIQENNVEEFDIEKEIQEKGYHDRYQLPIRESEEIAFIYQMLKYISDNQLDILSIAYGYGSSNKLQDHMEGFNNQVVQPLVDHIVNYLGEMKIDMGLDKKSGTHFTFNRDFKGQFNHAEGQGQVTAHQNYNEGNIEGLKEVAEKFVKELQKDETIPIEEKEEAVEFLEAAVQEAESEKPKKAILKTAMGKVRGINEIATTGTTLFNLGSELADTLGGFVG